MLPVSKGLALAGLYCDTSIQQNLPSGYLFALVHELQQGLETFTLIDTPPSQLPEQQFVLLVDARGLSLQATGKKAPGPIFVDFLSGANAHRRQFGGGKGQMIAKAIGLKSAYRPTVVDATAGLGQDAFVLASLGCHMTLVERSPIIYQLLHDGIQRAKNTTDHDVLEIVSNIQLVHANSSDYLQRLAQPIDVIYLDPMFPERNKKAQVNKSMQAFQVVVGEDLDAGELLAIALQKALYRVVVKRPRKAPSIDEQYSHWELPAPNVVLAGKSTRFDVYSFKKMP